MYLDLFTVPFLGIPVHTYGVLIVTGFLCAYYISYRQALRYGAYAQDILDVGFWALLGGILTARVVFILVNFNEYFVTDPWVTVPKLGITIPKVFALWEGGIVYWGSFIGGLAAAMIFARSRRLPLALFADLIVLGLPLAQAFGRLGCVASACCYGKPFYHLGSAGEVISDLPLSMRFPVGSLAYQGMMIHATQQEWELMNTLGTTLPLFPSQLAEAFVTFSIFLVLLFFYSRKRFHGQLMLTYVMLYSIGRSLLEIYRGDAERGFIIDGILSTSQFISILVAVFALVILAVMRCKKRCDTVSVTQ